MCIKMVIKKEIIGINKEFGGKLVRESSLDFACTHVDHVKSVYKKNALLLRAIVVDHPFDDFNKSTAIIIMMRLFKKHDVVCDETLLLRLIVRVAKHSVTDLHTLEKSLRKCCQKKN